MNTSLSGPRPNRRPFLLILAIFLTPVLAAYAVYYLFPGLRPLGTTNYGQLVRPAQSTPALDLRDAAGKPADARLFQGKWSMVYVGPADCAAGCRQAVHLSRQVRTALDRDARRMQRLYIAPDAAALAAARQLFPPEQHPDLLLFADAGTAGHRAADFFRSASADALYIVDPRGFWFMIYPPNPDPDKDFKGMLKDLKRIMSLSQVD